MREVNHPKEDAFIGLGYDDHHEAKRKHYRAFYPDELELNTDIFPKPSPFDQYHLKRGQARQEKSKSFYSFKRKEITTVKNVSVGYFKGMI